MNGKNLNVVIIQFRFKPTSLGSLMVNFEEYKCVYFIKSVKLQTIKYPTKILLYGDS